MFWEGDPKSPKGAIGWVVLGGVAALTALLVGSFIPGLIPTRATQVNL